MAVRFFHAPRGMLRNCDKICDTLQPGQSLMPQITWFCVHSMLSRVRPRELWSGTRSWIMATPLNRDLRWMVRRSIWTSICLVRLASFSPHLRATDADWGRVICQADRIRVNFHGNLSGTFDFAQAGAKVGDAPRFRITTNKCSSRFQLEMNPRSTNCWQHTGQLCGA